MSKRRLHHVLQFFHTTNRNKHTKKNKISSRDYNLIKKSKFFDATWYLTQYPDVAKKNANPIKHYLKFGWLEGRNPSQEFNGDEYLKLNPDVQACKINPLLHYIKYGQKEKRAFKRKVIHFPADAQPTIYTFAENINKKTNRIAIFACFAADCKIHDYVIYYLRELKKVCDGIIFIADNPLLPGEIEKLKDLVIYAQCERHEEYDFGSYKRGWQYAREKGYTYSFDEIIICNDSCYGPIYPLSNLFETMSGRECDFWGVLSNTDRCYHLQSFFYVFKNTLFQNTSFNQFWDTVKKEYSFLDVVFNYETRLTDLLIKEGYTATSYVPDTIMEFEPVFSKIGNKNKTVFPLSLVKNHQFPFIKVKVFNDGFGEYLQENPDDVLAFIETRNPALHKIMIKELEHKISDAHTQYLNIFKL